jgi:hypothetical protein
MHNGAHQLALESAEKKNGAHYFRLLSIVMARPGSQLPTLHIVGCSLWPQSYIWKVSCDPGKFGGMLMYHSSWTIQRASENSDCYHMGGQCSATQSSVSLNGACLRVPPSAGSQGQQLNSRASLFLALQKTWGPYLRAMLVPLVGR